MHAKLPADRGKGLNAPRSPSPPAPAVPSTARSSRAASSYLRKPGRPRKSEPGRDSVPIGRAPPAAGEPAPKDHFIVRGGLEFAGTHLILDLWGAQRLGDLEFIEQAMREAVCAARATLLHLHLHHFGGGGGVSGVAVLAESHISVHTWPERDFAAFDIFMCGASEPERAVEALKDAFQPARAELAEVRRGLV